MDKKSVTASEFPTITKKIRDEMLGETCTNFFRRSSFYMSIKVLLQHNLIMHLGTEDGTSLYKIVMLKFLTDTSAPYREYPTFDIDLLSQMIAKLARRIEKLILPENTSDEITKLHKTVVDETKETIRVIREKIDYQIYKIHQNDEKSAELPPLMGLNFSSDIRHKMTKLEKYLNERENCSPKMDSKKSKISTYDRYFEQGFPTVDTIETAKSDALNCRIFWIEFEKMVLKNEIHMDDDRSSATKLRTWSFEYAKYAEREYKGNQLFISRMLLVRLKLVAMLDRTATKKYPLLKEHQSGINPKIINSLLLPQIIDMKMANQLEKYFSERNARAKDPSLIGESTVSDSSFSVKYSKRDTNMKIVRDQIKVDDCENVEEKREEWKRGRQRVEDLKNQAHQMACEYYRNHYGWERHSFYCKRCALLNEAANVRVVEYERLLPDAEVRQFGIVFELKIPNEIACLRDVLYGFTEFCLDDAEMLKIKGDWKQRLSKYDTSTSEYLTLGSTATRKMVEYPVDCPFDRFIVENTFNCVFHAENKSLFDALSDDCLKKVCTFKTSGEYSDMQWTLDSTKHTENQVLSLQSECHQDLTLSKYKNFGSLRADGHRLQLRKLYGMIETEALAFENESVLALIMQTLWECEECGESGPIRESHIDFNDPHFCSAMIELLNKFLRLHRNSWKHPYKLLMVTLIAVRAFEINSDDSMAEEIAKLLHQIRVISLDWIIKIETTIRDLSNPNDKDERELRLKLIYVTITGGLTYFVHPQHSKCTTIFENMSEALQSWLQFRITLTNNIRLYTNDEEKLPPTLRMFLRLMDSVGVYMEPTIKSLAERNPVELFDFIRKQWTRSESAEFKGIIYNKKCPHIVQITAVNPNAESVQTVTIDIITGVFLVDGLPLSRLPHSIVQSEIYKWFFNNVVFEVQPEAQSTFSTKQTYNGCNYDFKMINKQIIIVERKTNEFEKELIDCSVFEDEFPYHLVNDYSHWWNKAKKCIEFRRRALDKKHFSKETDIDYYLYIRNHVRNGYLIHAKTQRKMLDIKSDSYKKVVAQLSRLEHSKYIHVLLESKETEEQNKDVANVELVRMNLKFTINCVTICDQHSDLISNEFGGMRLSRNQKVGTLYGLNNGLVLESISNNGATKILLIPNGLINTESNGIFASVSIDTELELNNPPFHQYQVNEFCRQLKASTGTDAAWFYLAYLHAITSHGEIEPFTGMSGTERSLQILQSAHVWSSSPYESEAVKILGAIAKLTPLRKLKQGREIVTWPDGIPQRSAQDCFVFIAAKLIADSQRLRKLYSNCSKQTIKLVTNLELNKRDHWRCQQNNPNLRVLRKFMEHKVLSTSKPNVNPVSFAYHTRYVCNLYHKQHFHVPSNLNLKKFLTKSNNLVGIENLGRVRNLLNHSVHEDFQNLWISLYEAARRGTLTSEQFAVILSFFAHQGENIEAIYALQAVAMNPIEFARIIPPAVNRFKIETYNERQMRDLLRSPQIKVIPQEYHSQEWSDCMRQRHELERTSCIDGIINDISCGWNNAPFRSFDFTTKWSRVFEYIDYASANKMMNKQLKTWFENHILNEFIESVEERLKLLPSSRPNSGQYSPHEQQIAENWTKHQIDFDAKVYNNLDDFQEEIEEARNIWQMNTRDSRRTANDWFKIYEKISNTEKTRHLIQSGIFPRLVPGLLLPKIADAETDDRLKCVIGAWALAIACEQRRSRIHTEKDESYSNWKPCEYPEWLLFEIEQNLTIRRIQIEIAKRMIKPQPNESDDKQTNSVMQLNMGEGKTSVIVPILATELANQDHTCQITVLKSLFNTNLKSLRQYLGGFLNRPIYTFPCRRDMPIEDNIEQILKMYEECKQNKGIFFE